MRSKGETKNFIEPNFDKELQILVEIESESDLTQRQLSQRMGIALGLTNTLLRNLIRKGYLRSQQASWKRWIYALTPEGVSHKIYLTVRYVKGFLNQYMIIRETLRDELEPLALHEESRVAMVGTGEFAELVFLGLKDLGIEELDVYSFDSGSINRFLGMPVLDLNNLLFRNYDRVLVANLDKDANNQLAEILGQDGDSDKLVTFFPDGGRGV